MISVTLAVQDAGECVVDVSDEKDPGIGGPKLSKSSWGTSTFHERNKSYNAVLDAQIAYIRAVQSNEDTPTTELNPEQLFERWQKKVEFHERAFGW